MGKTKKNGKKKQGNSSARSSKNSSNHHHHHHHAQDNTSNYSDDSFIWVDPTRVRFQHSRIRPYFSGCGRSVRETLEAIRSHQVDPIYDLPPIQVLIGSGTPTRTTPFDDDDDNNKAAADDDADSATAWYFSLNNRRLWVLKQCLAEGLLEKYDNLIRVRVREPKSRAEMERYTVENCALHAKLMRESSAHYSSGNIYNSSKNNDDDKKRDTTSIDVPVQEMTTCIDSSLAIDGVDVGLAVCVVASDEDEDDDADSSCSDDDEPVMSNRFTALL